MGEAGELPGKRFSQSALKTLARMLVIKQSAAEFL